uniref:Uncharacterized protein n=1 Tax=Mimiviridae sp. ChoanoV1 TaxID=2596887 RepID=A0A5B8IFZ8_9VIRU|nr:hypothetical protein 7_46 [Mimiviridae sp. ChoanoV1]
MSFELSKKFNKNTIKNNKLKRIYFKDFWGWIFSKK